MDFFDFFSADFEFKKLFSPLYCKRGKTDENLQNRWKIWRCLCFSPTLSAVSWACLCCTTPVIWNSSWIFLVNVIACVKSISSCEWNRNFISHSDLGRGSFPKERYDQDDWQFPTGRKVIWVCRSQVFVPL